MSKIILYPSFIDIEKCEYDSVDPDYPLENILKNTIYDDSNWTKVYMTKGGAAYTRLFFGFDFSQIPQNAIINDIMLHFSGRLENDSIARAGNSRVQILKGDQVLSKSSATVFKKEDVVDNITLSMYNSTVQRTELDDLRAQILSWRGFIGTNTSYYMLLKWCRFVVTYELPVPSSKIYHKKNGEWNAYTPYKKINGVWVEQTDVSSLFSGLSNGDTSPWIYQPLEGSDIY